MLKLHSFLRTTLVILTILILNLNTALSQERNSPSESETKCIYTKDLPIELFPLNLTRMVLETMCKVNFYIRNFNSKCPACKKDVQELCKSYLCIKHEN